MRLWKLNGSSWELQNQHESADTTVVGLAGAGDSVLVGHGTTVRRSLDSDGSWSSLGSPGSNFTAVGVFESTPLALVGGVVRSYASSTWSTMGTATDVVSLDTHGPKPVIASRTVSGTNATATVLEWNAAGSAWTPLGNGITGAAAGSAGIAVAADADGKVYRCANGIVSRSNR